MFDRIEKLIGKENLEKIGNVSILLVGLGGVGGTTLEALVRSGIKHITIIDKDTFDITNLNRQILSNQNNIGKDKVSEGFNHSKGINPLIEIKPLKIDLNGQIINTLGYYDYIIDACDDIKAKISLIKYAIDNNIKIIEALGTGKRLDPTKVIISRLDKTEGDPLAKKLRYELRKNDITLKIPVVYSKELPINKDTTITSSIFVPSTAGLYLAYYVINDIIKSN